MAYQKNPTAHYSNLGGINEKASVYTTQLTQFLNLRNVDFNVPNALSKRPGSTQAGATGTSGAIRSMFEFVKLSGASYLMASSDTALFYLTAAGYTLVNAGFTQPYDMLTFQDKLWAANGKTFIQWDGSTLLPYQLPCPPVSSNSGASGNGISNYFCGVTGVGVDTTQWGIYTAYSYLRQDGFESFVSPPIIQTIGDDYIIPFMFRVSGFTVPANKGITALGMYLWIKRGGTGGIIEGASVPVSNLKFITYMPTTTATMTIARADFIFQDLRGFSGSPICFGDTYTPKYIEIADNRLFMSGFSSAPSVTAYSDVARTPTSIETVFPNYFFEARTDDGDVITGIKNFQNELMVFKVRSFHKLIGNTPDNYQLVTLSTEYGCLSNKAIAESENLLYFLDQKGIVRFNGSDWEIISFPVEDTFRTMNLAAAREMADAVNYDFRNQIWFSIPVNGSTENNLVVVYDYLLQAWTFFDGFKAASLVRAKQQLATPRAWYGDYSGKIHYFGESFFGDNGTGITCMIQTGFDAPDGQNVENMFRRLFLDVRPVSGGVTGVINVEVLSDYDNSTVQATFAIYQNDFQTRADFGVMAKSIGFKMYHNSASLPLEMPGYLVQRRFLRNV